MEVWIRYGFATSVVVLADFEFGCVVVWCEPIWNGYGDIVKELKRFDVCI